MKIYGESDELLVRKWNKVLEAEDVGVNKITSESVKLGTARLLENTQAFLKAQQVMASAAGTMFAEDTPTNVAGGIAGYQQNLLGLIRRVGPTILGQTLVGSQPLTLPTGLVFAIRPRYQTQAGTELLIGAPRHTHTGLDSAGDPGHGAPVASDNDTNPFATTFTVGQAWGTAAGEGDVGAEIALTVDSVPVAARTRNLKWRWSIEMAQDLATQHGVDAGSMFDALAAQQIAAEINYEILRKLYFSAVLGAADTAVPGTFHLTNDTDGRWVGERGKVLAMRIQLEAALIMQNTRLGHGNFVVCDVKTYNVLYNSGLISDFGPSNNMFQGPDPVIRDNTVAVGRLGNMLVYRDDYVQMPAGEGFCLVGWKGATEAEAGMFYCPYLPVTMASTIDPASGQPISFAKTRYGLVSNPLAGANGAVTARSNPVYRLFKVAGLRL